PVALGDGGVVHPVDPDVNDDGAGAHHVGGDELRLADGGDDDIGAADHGGEIARLRVTDGDGGIAAGTRLDQEVGHRLPDDGAAADDHRVRAPGLDAVPQQHLDHPPRGAGAERGRVADHQLADVDG